MLPQVKPQVVRLNQDVPAVSPPTDRVVSTRPAMRTGETKLCLGQPSGDHVLIEITARSYPEAQDYWDANWLQATAKVQVGPFRARFETSIRTNELLGLRHAFQALHQSLDGSQTFETLENWISLDITGDGRGHFVAACVIRDDPGSRNRLTFDLTFDQTEIPELVESVETILEVFPVVGTES